MSDERISNVPDGSEQLKSWKEIAAYFERDVRTVQRWQRHGMPIRRYAIGGKNSVYAVKSELDAWFSSMQQSGTQLSAEGLTERAIQPRNESWLDNRRRRRGILGVLTIGTGVFDILVARNASAEISRDSPLYDSHFCSRHI